MTEDKNLDRRQDALAASSPDDKHILMRMMKLLLDASEKHPLLNGIAVPIVGVIMLVFVLAIFGVPAILAGQSLIMNFKESETQQVVADRAVQAQQVTATREVLDAIGEIGGKLDSQTAKIDDQGRRIDALSEDVSTLQKSQGATERSISEIRNRQRSMEAARARATLPRVQGE